jgi:hypothetical protein
MCRPRGCFQDEAVIGHAKEALLPPWPVFESCKEQHIPVTLVLVFATDSASLEPAQLLAGVTGLQLGLNLEEKPVKVPASWASLYGCVRA